MKAISTMTGLVAVVMLVFSAIPASAQAQLPEIEPYEVGMAQPPIADDDVVVRMSLDEAIARALQANLDIQSVRLNPSLQAFAYRQARTAFNPDFSANLGYNNSSNQSTSQLDGGSTITNERISFNSSLAQPLPWYGGRLSANFNNSRSETNNTFATRNPSFSSSISFQYTQPLLAGLQMDPQRAQIRTQTIQLDITDLQVEAQIASITNQIRQRYWGLRASIEQIEIQRRSLAQAQETLSQNQVRLQAGQGTSYQVTQAEAQVASAEQSLLNAEIQWTNAELAFKQLLLDGASDELLGQRIIPIDLPTVVDQQVDLDGAIDRALATRLDLQQARRQVDISEVNLDVTESSALPDLSLSASYALQGVGGDRFERSELGGSPVLVESGGYSDGLQSILDREAPTWNISLSGSYPIGTNPDRLNLERAELQLRQQNLSLRTQELNVVTQVTSAGLAVSNTFLQYQAAQRSADASEQNLQAELARFQVGVATNFELVQAQNQLTSARLQELQALINHVNAIATFEQVQVVGN
jgi:outer membrane protein TolC